MRKRNLIPVFIMATLLLFACAKQENVLNVMVHDSFAINDSVVSAFEMKNQVKVNFLLSGDAGSMLNQAILTKGDSVVDIIYGIDNTFLSRALEEKLFDEYPSPLLDQIPDSFKLDASNSMLPVDYGDVCINYDRAFFEESDLAVPTSFNDLIDPAYQGLLVVENPATSSPGLAFLLATITEFGEDGYLQYWQKLLENGAVIVNDWETAYYSNFSASSGNGAQAMVVSYGTSPAAEVIFSETTLDEAPTASITNKNMCFRQVEFAGILSGSRNRKIAEKFIDYMLETTFQNDIPLNMFVFPVNRSATVPQEFLEYVQVPDSPASLPMDLIASNREKWINAWREMILD